MAVCVGVPVEGGGSCPAPWTCGNGCVSILDAEACCGGTPAAATGPGGWVEPVA
jgi:hypothetical protein